MTYVTAQIGVLQLFVTLPRLEPLMSAKKSN
jgi:hypothetical protein